MRKIPDEKAQAVRELVRTGRDQREIARILGVSKGYVSGVLRAPWRVKAAARRAAPRPVATPTLPALPTPPTAEEMRAARRLELVAARDEAETPETFAAATLAILRHDDADLDHYLSDQSELIDALVSSGHDALWVIRTPEAFASLAELVTEDVGAWCRDDGETEEQFTAWLAERRVAAHARAVTLLEEAAVIARAAKVPA